MSVEQLAELSRHYGSSAEWVLAGGGNTSFKDESTLFVKASGFPLATIRSDGFARMDRRALAKIWDARYPPETEAREAAALAELMAARLEGEEKRPSVETLMHELFPYRFVVHTHPTLVNGLACGRNGERAARDLFGDRALWIPAIEPGYILAVEMRRAARAWAESHGEFPRLVILQNHGLVVAADSPEEIDSIHREVRATLSRALVREPDFSDVAIDNARRDRWHTAIELAWQERIEVEFTANAELSRRLASEAEFAPLAGAFTPDHIVYAGAEPLFVDGDPVNAAAGLRSRIVSYRTDHGSLPRILAVEGLGVFSVTGSLQETDTAMSLFLDEVRIAAYAESFGGARHLDPHLVDFIESWEVERYRKKMSGGAS